MDIVFMPEQSKGIIKVPRDDGRFTSTQES